MQRGGRDAARSCHLRRLRSLVAREVGPTPGILELRAQAR
jgi:hypothetical protein